MDSNTNIRYRKRGLTFLVASILMLVLGETALHQMLSKASFVIYWTVCFLVTGLAILFAVLDLAGMQRRARQEQRDLLEKTVRDIARQKEIKSGRVKPE
jgi:hypothetical protein